MDKQIVGIHHVTAIASDAQENLDFYVGVLGLRLVKQTVNFDDPGTYHLYYGDEVGTPGTIMTFFPIPGAHQGKRGSGQFTTTSFSIPDGAIGYWVARFKQLGVEHEPPLKRFDEEVIAFYDTDRLQLELIARQPAAPFQPWVDGGIPVEKAIRGFFHVTLTESSHERTARLLTDTMGFQLVAQEDNRYRYAIGAGGAGATVDVLHVPGMLPGRTASGSVHHVAWRTPDDDQQKAWRESLASLGYNVSPVMDRNYFHSIYYREPGGALFEIATDPPGFSIDETVAQLGTGLKLPPQYEPIRAQLEYSLPRLVVPEVQL